MFFGYLLTRPLAEGERAPEVRHPRADGLARRGAPQVRELAFVQEARGRLPQGAVRDGRQVRRGGDLPPARRARRQLRQDQHPAERGDQEVRFDICLGRNLKGI